MKNPESAAHLNEQGRKCLEKGELEQAIEFFEQATKLDPTGASPFYNLGLVYKRLRAWEQSLEANQRATALAPDDEAAWWNLGIAATALGRWEIARSAWRGFGIDIPEGEGPIDLPCGVNPIRLHPDDMGEVVWAQRLDPARALLLSIPLPESNHRFQDIVLNDGSPEGHRHYQGREVPVFNALELLQPSRFGTYLARVVLPKNRPDVDPLILATCEAGGSAEDWSTSVHFICKACSEGRPHTAHDEEATPPEGVHLIGIAARDREHAEEIRAIWESAPGGVQIEAFEEALEPNSTES